VRRRAPTLLDLAAHLAVAGGLALLVAEVWLGLDRLVWPTVLLTILAVAGLFTAGLARVAWRWWTGESALVLRVFEHADDRLGAGKYEARRAARIKRSLDILSGNWRAATRPAYRPGDVQVTRIHRYVRLAFDGHRPPLRRWRRVRGPGRAAYWRLFDVGLRADPNLATHDANPFARLGLRLVAGGRSPVRVGAAMVLLFAARALARVRRVLPVPTAASRR